MPLLPNCKQAFIAIEKLSEYCLNPFHPVGKDKAMVFKSVLNLTEQDTDFQKDAILDGLARNEVFQAYKISMAKDLQYIKIRNLDLEATIRTAWIIKKGENFPRLINCYIK